MRFTRRQALAGLLSLTATSLISIPVQAARKSFQGVASWYGPGFHGRTTASGERYNMDAMTAAHKTLPFGTKVRVTNLRNNKKVTVRINDRGPYHGGRVIDLSRAAARKISMIQAGTAKVKVDIV